MEKIAELRAKRAEKITALTAQVAKMAADGYAETADDTKLYDGLKADIDGIDRNIARVEEANRLKASLSTPVVDRAAVPASARRAAPLKNITGPDATERAFRMGQFFLGALFEREKAAGWCRDNGILIPRAMSEGVNSQGGVLVPEEIENEIITLRNSYGLARRLLRVVPMGRDTLTIPKWTSGLTMYFVGEGAAITQSTAGLTNVRLTAKKAGVLTLISSELDEDAVVSIGDFLAGEFGYAFAKGEDDCLFQGDGTSIYGGMTGFRKIFNDGVGTLAGAVDAASGHDTEAEYDAPDIAKCMGALPQYVFERGKPAFIMSQTMWSNVFERLIGASGGVTKDQASGRTIREYNGYPVELTPSMLAPASSTTDASDVANWLFGDVAMAAAMGDRRGMAIARSTEYKFAEDQIAFKATERFDIVVHHTGDATNAGAVVAMMGE